MHFGPFLFAHACTLIGTSKAGGLLVAGQVRPEYPSCTLIPFAAEERKDLAMLVTSDGMGDPSLVNDTTSPSMTSTAKGPLKSAVAMAELWSEVVRPAGGAAGRLG